MQNILNNIVYESIAERIGRLNGNSKRRWGIMSTAQMLAHCSDQIRLAMGEKQPHEKPGFFNRTVMKYAGLWLPRIPIRNLKAPVDMDQKFYGTASADVETEKANLVHLLQQVRSLPEEKVLLPHPMFGKLSRKQWGRFMYVHIDHHLRQFRC